MKKTGLFFGSFNPIHVGHLIIANYLSNESELDEIWLVVSPQNPFKEKKSLASNYDRIHLVNLAIEDHLDIKASNIEFDLPKPSYTIDTLSYLYELYPAEEFSLIMGGDNLASFHKWKNYEQILEKHDIYVYRRPGYSSERFNDHNRVTFVDAPLLDISATFVRKAIRSDKSIKYLVPTPVYEYVSTSHLYRK